MIGFFCENKTEITPRGLFIWRQSRGGMSASGLANGDIYLSGRRPMTTTSTTEATVQSCHLPLRCVYVETKCNPFTGIGFQRDNLRSGRSCLVVAGFYESGWDWDNSERAMLLKIYAIIEVTFHLIFEHWTLNASIEVTFHLFIIFCCWFVLITKMGPYVSVILCLLCIGWVGDLTLLVVGNGKKKSRNPAQVWFLPGRNRTRF